jgi:hypothetical protein
MLSATHAFGAGAAGAIPEAVAAVELAINENDRTADAIKLRMAILLGFQGALLHNGLKNDHASAQAGNCSASIYCCYAVDLLLLSRGVRTRFHAGTA